MGRGFDSRLWDEYAPYFDAEEGTVFPVDALELRFYAEMRNRFRGDALEIGAGCGRLAGSLYLPPHRTVALEPSAGMLARWRRADASRASRIMALGQEMPFRDGAFRFVTFPYNGLHCLPGPDERIALLSEARRLLARGGRLLLETCPGFSRRPQDTDAERYDFHDGRLRLRLSETVRRNADSISFHMKYDSGGRRVSELELELALIPPGLLSEELARAGLETVELWGDYDCSPFDPCGSPRMLTLASRKDRV